MNDKKNTVVAGLQVHHGKLKVPNTESKSTKASGEIPCKYSYKVIRNGTTVFENIIESAALKRHKDTVYEVSSHSFRGISGIVAQ